MSEIKSLLLLHRGKVGDIYDIGEVNGESLLLIVRSDRVSGLNAKLSTPMPGKGVILNQMSVWWMKGLLASVIPNHLTGYKPEEFLTPQEAKPVKGRAIVVKKLKPILVEAVVRANLAGTGYQSYLKYGEVCGIKLPPGLVEGARLDQPIFTPTEKSEKDPPITFEQMCDLVGKEIAEKVRATSLKIFEIAERHLSPRGIIVADTKFEFGMDNEGNVVLMDEVLTPDSSRFWLKEPFETRHQVVSLDKQKVRDWLSGQKSSGTWDGSSAISLPEVLVKEVSRDYKEIFKKVIR